MILAVLAACAGPDAGALQLDVQVETFARQPMVADLKIRADRPLDDIELSIEHATDSGVRARIEQVEGATARVRVRGLSPDTDHQLRLRVTAGSATNDERVESIELRTPVARPGFLSAFAAAGDPGAVDPSYRLFDLTDTPSSAISGAIQIDAAGVTRWYLGDMLDIVGPSRVWAGLKLRADGSLLFLLENAVVIVDELGEEVLRIHAAELGLPSLHHDVIELPDGAFVALSHSFADVDYEGEGTLRVAGDLLVEFDREGRLRWTWDTFDHLDPQRRRDGFFSPLLVPEPGGDGGHDWTHGNGLVYRSEDDSLLLSMRHQDWVIAIERSTDAVRWRLGPEGDFELQGGRWFFHQHSPEWQLDGTLLLYDNGVGDPDLADDEERSRAVRYALDTKALTAREVWTDEPEPFVAPVAGDADLMPSGHVLVLDSSIFGPSGEPDDFHSRLRELDAGGREVWRLETSAGRFAYRALPTERIVGEVAR